MLAMGCSSWFCLVLLRSKFHISSCVSFEKSASTAPALVPVAINGEEVPGDHANVAVLGISRSLTIVTEVRWLQRVGFTISMSLLGEIEGPQPLLPNAGIL